MMRELAYQTYIGIKSYFNNDEFAEATPTTLLPYSWKKRINSGDKNSLDVLALQLLLRIEGYYPKEASLNDCPISGNFGECTVEALKEYQKDKNLRQTGVLDTATRRILNSSY